MQKATTYLISISYPLKSRTALPIAIIWSSFLPDKLIPSHRNNGKDDRKTCINCDSMRCFLGRSNTEIPSNFKWLIGLFRIHFDIVLRVLFKSSKWITQLHIFNVLRRLQWERNSKIVVIAIKHFHFCL